MTGAIFQQFPWAPRIPRHRSRQTGEVWLQRGGFLPVTERRVPQGPLEARRRWRDAFGGSACYHHLGTALRMHNHQLLHGDTRDPVFPLFRCSTRPNFPRLTAIWEESPCTTVPANRQSTSSALPMSSQVHSTQTRGKEMAGIFSGSDEETRNTSDVGLEDAARCTLCTIRCTYYTIRKTDSNDEPYLQRNRQVPSMCLSH